MVATVDVVSANSSWNGCWLRLSYRGKGRHSQGSNFSTEMGDGSHRSPSEPRVLVVSDLCRREEMKTRARREMELGGNIGQGRQLAINVCLRPKACQAVSRTNTMSQIIAMPPRT